MKRTIIRKRTHDYREAFELIQKEAVPGGQAWSITYDKSDKEYVATVIKTDEEEKAMTTLTPKPTEDKVYVVGFDQYAGGSLPVTEAHLTDLADVFTTVLTMLTKHDKVSIISTEDYSILDHDFASMSKYSINIWQGEWA